MSYRVYIAGPLLTSGHLLFNARDGIDAGEKVMVMGHHAFVPHYNVLHDLVYRHPGTFWLEQDFGWLSLCDALIRLPGDSRGADAEVSFCLERSIPVFFSVEEFLSAAALGGIVKRFP